MKGRSSFVVKKELTDRLAKVGIPGRTEADIQSDVRQLLLDGNFGLDEPRLEVQTADGTKRRIDVQIGATVIEVKRDLGQTGVLAAAVPQLSDYVKVKTEQEESRYNGVLTDGQRWMLFENDPATGVFTKRSEFSLGTGEGSAGMLVEWLQSVLATHANVKPTAATIEASLGASSPAYAQDHAFLTGLYQRVCDDPTVTLKRALWARLLRSALGTGFDDDQRLFVDHTLLVIEATAIGHAIMGISTQDLVADPTAMLDGAEFRSAGIENVIEADFFDWLLADPDGARFVARVIQRIAVFNWHSTEHDVLKVLYESVIRADTRKSLGEYYTPDWLAEGIVTKCVTDPLQQRVLDPACGSGTFVYHAVRRFLVAAEAAGWDNQRTLNEVQAHVYGMDIHPVSVVLARITYLLALGDRLMQDRDTITVPVYLGDSVQWSQDATSSTDTIKVRVDGADLAPPQTQQSVLLDIAEVLAFPLANIDDAETFDRLVRDMTNRAKEHTDTKAKRPAITPILRRYGVDQGKDAQVLAETFKLLCDLHAQGRDSIWGYFVRNQVRPLWLSMPSRRVDVLVGNPPWVAYRNMTSAMQSQFKEFSEKRGLWHGKKVATSQDLVGLFIARAVELYLNQGGTFGFVTPLAVLSRQQYEGFRAGKWGPIVRGDFTEPWDLDQVRPAGFFPVPSGVVFGTRHDQQAATYGSTEAPAGFPATKLVVAGLRDKSGWLATQKQLTFTQTTNTVLTVDDDVSTSAYGATAIQGATIVPKYLFFIEEEAQASKLGQAANKVKVRSKRSAQEKEPWKNRPGLTATVERRFIHRVHLGATITPFRPLRPELTVLPVLSDELLAESEIPQRSGIADWWTKAANEWEDFKSKNSRLSLLQQLDFQGKMRRQLGGAKHRVVYSASGNSLVAARVDDPTIVVEHGLYWMPTTSLDEACYLTAILNAPATTKAVAEYQSRGLFGARHFDKYVWRLAIPKFDPGDDTHLMLAHLAQRAERAARETDLPDGVGFQQKRKLVREALERAGITPEIDALVTALLGIEEVVDTVPVDPLLKVKADAIRQGKILVRTDGSQEPLFENPDVAIDLDCEFDDHGVYLWGATHTTPQGSEHRAFGAPDADEHAITADLLAWLHDTINDALNAGDTVKVFHYGHVEVTHLRRLVGDDEVLQHFVDMLPVLREHCFAPHGYGLKTIAPVWGATWRTPGATGADTIRWIAAARTGDAASWSRLLEYNEDDTRATRALRRQW